MGPEHRAEYDKLLATETFVGVKAMNKKTYEEGMERGFERGKEEGFERGLEEGFERGSEEGLERGSEEGLERGEGGRNGPGTP